MNQELKFRLKMILIILSLLFIVSYIAFETSYYYTGNVDGTYRFWDAGNFITIMVVFTFFVLGFLIFVEIIAENIEVRI